MVISPGHRSPNIPTSLSTQGSPGHHQAHPGRAIPHTQEGPTLRLTTRRQPLLRRTPT